MNELGESKKVQLSNKDTVTDTIIENTVAKQTQINIANNLSVLLEIKLRNQHCRLLQRTGTNIFRCKIWLGVKPALSAYVSFRRREVMKGGRMCDKMSLS